MYFALYPFLLGLLSFVTIYCFFKERQALKKEEKNKECRHQEMEEWREKMEKFHENMKKYKGKKPPPFPPHPPVMILKSIGESGFLTRYGALGIITGFLFLNLFSIYLFFFILKFK